jgi:ABC-type antimicrobial peptide transport system permease subunit
MDLRDTFWLSSKQLNEKKVRTALTILMVVIGVASIVALTSLTAGAGQSIQSSLSALGPTSIVVTATGSTAFTQADITNLETLPNVSSVTPILTGSATMLFNGNISSVTIVGISTEGLQTLLGGNVSLYQGSLYQDNVAPLAVIGHSLAFSSSVSPDLQTITTGQTATLEIGGGRGSSSKKVSVPIEGIFQPLTSIVPIDTGVLVSMPFAEVLLNKLSFNEILIKANNASSVTSLSSLISTVYGSNARVMNTEQLASTASTIIGEISLLFTAIAGVSLLVAAVGIMNVMLMSVSERVHEIGIFKAVGFKNREVMFVFLFQALIIGFLGGIVGLGVGAGAAYSLASVLSRSAASSTTGATTTTAASSSSGFSRTGGGGSFAGGGAAAGGGVAVRGGAASTSTMSIHPAFTLSIITEAILIAAAVSVLAGVYPAWKASRMEPIDALREL